MAPTNSSRQTTVAVVGGGINGLCCAWQLALRGARVTLFERGLLSPAASGMAPGALQGGLYLLEPSAWALVQEALRESRWWLQHGPEFCREVRQLLPVYRGGPLTRRHLAARLHACRLLDAGHGGTTHEWLSRQALLRLEPRLEEEQLLGGYTYGEIAVDIQQLGQWVAKQARAAGAQIMEQAPVLRITAGGDVELDRYRHRFDAVVNATGNHCAQLLRASGLPCRTAVTLVRNSHLLLRGAAPRPSTLTTPGRERAVFVTPLGERTLLGSTEVTQSADGPAATSTQEILHLLQAYNRCFKEKRGIEDIEATRSRAHTVLLRRREGPSLDYRIERHRQVLSVFGGRWGNARLLGKRVAENLLP